MNDIRLHPFDLDFNQIGQHREQYKFPKQSLRNANPIAKATLESVFLSLSQKIHLHTESWKSILRQFDQSSFQPEAALNVVQQPHLQMETDLHLARNYNGNYTETFDFNLLLNKIEFSDFLKAIQRESILRTILQEHQLYFFSFKRLIYSQDTKLITKEALRALKIAKQQNKTAKVPVLTYLIDNFQMLEFQGQPLLLILFENHSVKLFESDSGHFAHEFQFVDNTFDSSNTTDEEIREKEKALIEDAMTQQSNLSKLEMKFQMRKSLREQGLYRPAIPKFTNVSRIKINQKVKEKKSTVNKSMNHAALSINESEEKTIDNELNFFKQQSRFESMDNVSFKKQMTQTFGVGIELEYSRTKIEEVDEEDDVVYEYEKDETILLSQQLSIKKKLTMMDEKTGSMERINLQMMEHDIKSKLDAHADPRECCEEELIKMAEGNYKIHNYINRLKFNTIDASVDDNTIRGNSSMALRSAHIANERSSSPIKLFKMKQGQYNLESPSTIKLHQMKQGYTLDIIKQEQFESENSPVMIKKGTQLSKGLILKKRYGSANDDMSDMISPELTPVASTQLKTSLQESIDKRSIQKSQNLEKNKKAKEDIQRIKDNPHQREGRSENVMGFLQSMKINMRQQVSGISMQNSLALGRSRLDAFKAQDKDQTNKLLNNITDEMELEGQRKEVFAKQQQQMGAVFAKAKAHQVKEKAQPKKHLADQAINDDRDHGHHHHADLSAQAKKLEKMTRKEQHIFLRNQKRIQQQNERNLSKQKHEKTKKVQFYGILGLDPLDNEGGGSSAMNANKDSQTSKIYSIKQQYNINEHAFGLPQKLFTSKKDYENHYEAYQEALDQIKYQRKTNQQTVDDIRTKRQFDDKINKIKAQTGCKKAIAKLEHSQGRKYGYKQDMPSIAEATKVFTQMQDNQNDVEHRIIKLKEKQDVLGEMITEVIDLNGQDKNHMQEKGVDHTHLQNRNRFRVKEEEIDIHSKTKDQEKTRKEYINARNARKGKSKNPLDVAGKKTTNFVQEEAKSSKPKTTYPMCMEYYEPENAAIFALVSREVQIHKLKQTGVKITFQCLQTLRVQHMIVQMCIEKHKMTGLLLLCLGTKSRNPLKSEIVAYKMDPKLEFEVVESYRWVWPEEMITSVYYRPGCGLILCSFTGYMEFYDPVNITESVWPNIDRKNYQSKYGSISSCTYSDALDIIAISGVGGKIYILDQETKINKGSIDAHTQEILMMKFYDQQHQLLSVSITGEVGVWDAQTLTKIQMIRNGTKMTQKVLSSCSFYERYGRILLATSKIYNYNMEIDREVKIYNEQQNTVARDYLRNFFHELAHAGIIEGHGHSHSHDEKEGEDDGHGHGHGNGHGHKAIEAKPAEEHSHGHGHDHEEKKDLAIHVDEAINPLLSENGDSKVPSTKNSHHHDSVVSPKSNTGKPPTSKNAKNNKSSIVEDQKNKYRHVPLTEHQFIQKAYNDDSIKDYVPHHKEFNGSVLPSFKSKLIGVIIDPIGYYLYSIDSDLMVRMWSMSSGKCQRSYYIETREDQISESQNIGSKDAKKTSTIEVKATLAKTDASQRHVIIGYEGGQIQINDLYTGALIYNNQNFPSLKLEIEITSFKFFEAQTTFWVAASCWDGNVCFVSRPQTSQGRSFLKYKKVKCSHKRDVMTLDINSESNPQLVTGASDNTIVFWNCFSGQESKMVQIPKEFADPKKGQQLLHLRFPFKNKKDYLLVIINNGACYILEIQSENWMKYYPPNCVDSLTNNSQKDIFKQQSKKSIGSPTLDIQNVDGDNLDSEFNIGIISTQREGSNVKDLKTMPNLNPSPQNSPQNQQEDHLTPSKTLLQPPDIGSNCDMCTTSAFSGLESPRVKQANTKPLKVEVKKEDKRKIATIASSPFIDFKPIDCDPAAFHTVALISVSENGEGFLHNIKYNNGMRKKPKMYKTLTSNAQGSIKAPIDFENNEPIIKNQNQIEIEEIKDFQVNTGFDEFDPSNLVFQIDLLVDHQMFLTSQTKGVITIFSYPDCEILSILNKAEVKMPMQIDLESIEISNPVHQPHTSSHVHQRAASSHLGFRISKQAKLGQWHPALKESLKRNKSKFQSGIFDSIWAANNFTNDQHQQVVTRPASSINGGGDGHGHGHGHGGADKGGHGRNGGHALAQSMDLKAQHLRTISILSGKGIADSENISRRSGKSNRSAARYQSQMNSYNHKGGRNTSTMMSKTIDTSQMMSTAVDKSSNKQGASQMKSIDHHHH